MIQNRLQSFGFQVSSWKSIATAAAGLSHAEIARACNDAAKDSILGDQSALDAKHLAALLRARHRSESAAR